MAGSYCACIPALICYDGRYLWLTEKRGKRIMKIQNVVMKRQGETNENKNSSYDL